MNCGRKRIAAKKIADIISVTAHAAANCRLVITSRGTRARLAGTQLEHRERGEQDAGEDEEGDDRRVAEALVGALVEREEHGDQTRREQAIPR